MRVTDFSRSYQHWTRPPQRIIESEDSYKLWSRPSETDAVGPSGEMDWGNSARIQLEARAVLTDEVTGESDEFFLIVPCRAEWMYREDALFQMPNWEYRQIYSRTRGMGLCKALTSEGEQPFSTTLERYTSTRLVVKPLSNPRVLEDDKAVIEATEKRLPMVAQTEISDAESGMRAVVEYPVKTMNYHPERNRFQVDTGPVMWPDFSVLSEQWIECFCLAYVIYNRFDRADFIVRRQTAVTIDGKEVCQVLHYAEIHQQEAKHTIFCGNRAE